MTAVPRSFPDDMCSLIASSLACQRTDPGAYSILDYDWRFVSCAASRNGSEIIVTLAAARKSEQDECTDCQTHILIGVDDLDVHNGRALGMSIPDLVLELLEVFTRQAEPCQVPETIRLPGWTS